MNKIDFFNNSSLSYRWSWMEKHIDRGYFGVDNPVKKNIVREVMNSLETFFPGAWSFEFLNYNTLPIILFHFPKFVITNSIGDKHIIRDLFVRLKIRLNGNTIDTGCNLSGFRTTLTDKEYLSGYIHSHLHVTTEAFKNFQEIFIDRNRDFCLGTSEILDIMQLIENQDFDKNLFDLFLLTLKDVFKWESIEGGPYISMSKISSSQASSRDGLYNVQGDITDFLDVVYNNKDLLKKFNYIFTDNSVAIIEDQTFIDNLKSFLIRKGLLQYLCTMKNASYYKIADNCLQGITNNKKGILFRGSPIELKIINENFGKKTFDENLNTILVHPEILVKLLRNLNIRLTKKYIIYYEKKQKVERARKALAGQCTGETLSVG